LFKLPSTSTLLDDGIYFNSQKYFFNASPKILKDIGFKFNGLGTKMYLKKTKYYNIRLYVCEKLEIEIDNSDVNTEMIDFILENIDKEYSFWVTKKELPEVCHASMGKFRKTDSWYISSHGRIDTLNNLVQMEFNVQMREQKIACNKIVDHEEQKIALNKLYFNEFYRELQPITIDLVNTIKDLVNNGGIIKDDVFKIKKIKRNF